MSRQFSGRQEFYPSRSGGTLGADRKAATALVYQEVVAGVLSTVAIQGDTGALLVLQATALGTDNIIINAALVYVSALGGGSIYIEQSTYAIDDPIDFPGNNLSVYGAGVDTFIDGDALATGEHAFQISGRTDCSIRYLSVQTEDGGGKICHCIFIEDGSDRFVVEHVIIVDSDDDGIHVEGTTIDTGHILHCEILDVDGVGVDVDMDGGNFIYRLHVEGCDVGNCGGIGINLAPSPGNFYCEIINNVTYSCGADGIRVVDGSYGLICGNICIFNGGDGIEVNGTIYAQVLGNICYQNVQHGILLDDSDYCTVEGNTCIENDSGDTATYDGINIDADSTRNMVLGNICNLNHRYGIYLLGAGSSANSNVCAENDQFGILINTPNCKINDNRCYHNGADANNTYDGITLWGSADRCTINGNTCYSDGTRQRHGIALLNAATDCTVNGNICYLNATDGIQLEANNTDCVITGNQCLSNGAYGINIAAATCLRNRVKDNILRLNGTAPFQDLGTDTQLEELPVYVIDPDTNLGTHPAVNLPDNIDTTVRFQVQIPLELQQIVTAQIIVVQTVTVGSPDMQWSTVTNFGKLCNDQSYIARNDAETDQTTAITQNDLECIDVLASLDGVLAGDLIGFEFIRRATQAGDTIDGAAFWLGVRIRYV